MSLEHSRLKPGREISLVAIDYTISTYGAVTIISSLWFWYVEGLSQAIANVEMFIDLTVATLMVLLLLDKIASLWV